jgi:hypothetical protein
MRRVQNDQGAEKSHYIGPLLDFEVSTITKQRMNDVKVFEAYWNKVFSLLRPSQFLL